MAHIPKAPELANLSVSDRLDLMEEIWMSLVSDGDAGSLPERHMEEIKRRLAAFTADGYRGRPADQVFAELKHRYGFRPFTATVTEDRVANEQVNRLRDDLGV